LTSQEVTRLPEKLPPTNNGGGDSPSQEGPAEEKPVSSNVLKKAELGYKRTLEKAKDRFKSADIRLAGIGGPAVRKEGLKNGIKAYKNRKRPRM